MRISRNQHAKRRHPPPEHRRISGLNPAMACDTAFRIIARHCLADLAANQPATSEGDPAALHRMRIALTRLRTAIVFFSPVVADANAANKARAEMAEYTSRRVRDLDVAVERLAAAGNGERSALQSRARNDHARLARTLSSARYRQLCRQHAHMGREWVMVDHPAQTGRATPRLPDRRL